MSPEEQLLEEMNRLLKENDRLRYILAKSDIPCIYCGEKKMARCRLGFPGCSRGDDLLLGEYTDPNSVQDDSTAIARYDGDDGGGH